MVLPDADVEPNAKKLFSDQFMLAYLRYINKYGAIKYFNTLIGSNRPDVRQFAHQCIDEIQDLHKKADEILIKKGFFSKEAYIPIPDRIDFIHSDRSLFKSLFGDKQPINGLEIAQVFAGLEVKMLQKPIVIGFMQVVQSRKVQDFLVRCKKIMDEQIRRSTQILRDEDLPLPMSLVHELTDSTESPFSDKLITFHILGIIKYSLTGYGIAMASCTRADILTALHKSLNENTSLAKDAMALLMHNGWMEKIPQAANRKKLRDSKH
ncbi:MAG: DUF3231 family protein [Desulfosporosinus sp.]|jgi:spore coat protein CotF